MVNVSRGDETISVPRLAETSPGKWEEVGSDDLEAREVFWRRLQAGGTGYQGGQFTTEGGKRFAVPLADYGWLWMEHAYEAPVTLRYVIVPETDNQPTAVYLWNPSDGEGVAVTGDVVEFKRVRKNKTATNGALTIGWDFPTPVEAVENNPSGSGELSVTFTPGPAEASAAFADYVQADIDRQKGKR